MKIFLSLCGLCLEFLFKPIVPFKFIARRLRDLHNYTETWYKMIRRKLILKKLKGLKRDSNCFCTNYVLRHNKNSVIVRVILFIFYRLSLKHSLK